MTLMPVKVDFTVCGTQKGGTSALYNYLKTHPQICMSAKKELHFFDKDEHFVADTPDYTAYHAAFQPQPGQRRFGEATPVYMYWQDAPRRLWQYNPDMKLIVLLRNPIERAYSHWNMEIMRQRESMPFGAAIRGEAQRCREALPAQHRIYSYVDRGFYSEQLRRLWRYFPRQQVLVMKSEQLAERPVVALADICNFLGVDRFAGRVPRRRANARPYTETMGEQDKIYLRSIYEPEIQMLEHMLNWDCAAWLKD